MRCSAEPSMLQLATLHVFGIYVYINLSSAVKIDYCPRKFFLEHEIIVH